MNYVWMRGASSRPRYIAIGHRPNDLYPLLSYLTGLRETAERLVMRLPARLLYGTAPWDGAEAAIESVLADQSQPPSALFLYTGYYKETIFVGPVVLAGDGGRIVFWKAFGSQEDIDDELERASNLARIIPAGVTSASCVQRGARLVEYEQLVRAGWRGLTRGEHVACVTAIANSSVRGVSTDRPAVPLEAAVVRSFVDLARYSDVPIEALSDELERCSGLPLYLSHGDLTRWNLFRTPDGRVAVVDYDEVGFRPAYFDVVHGLAQEAAQRGKVPPVALMRSAVAQAPQGAPRLDLAASLFWDAYETMRQHLAHPDNRAATEAVVRLKLAAWSTSRA